MRACEGKLGLRVVELLLTDGRLNPEHKDSIALVRASAQGRGSVVALLLSDSRVDPSTNNNKCIREAVRSEVEEDRDQHEGRMHTIRLLLADSRVDPSADNNQAVRSTSVEYREENGYDMTDRVKILNVLLGHPKIPLTVKEQYADVEIPDKLIHSTLEDLRKIIMTTSEQQEEQINTRASSLLTKYVQLKLCSRVRYWWSRLSYR